MAGGTPSSRVTRSSKTSKNSNAAPVASRIRTRALERKSRSTQTSSPPYLRSSTPSSHAPIENQTNSMVPCHSQISTPCSSAVLSTAGMQDEVYPRVTDCLPAQWPPPPISNESLGVPLGLGWPMVSNPAYIESTLAINTMTPDPAFCNVGLEASLPAIDSLNGCYPLQISPSGISDVYTAATADMDMSYSEMVSAQDPLNMYTQQVEADLASDYMSWAPCSTSMPYLDGQPLPDNGSVSGGSSSPERYEHMSDGRPTHVSEDYHAYSNEPATSKSKEDSSSSKNKGEAIVFACPFFRLDHIRYIGCLNLKMTRIRDIKQHLQRRHYRVPIDCKRCKKEFRTTAMLCEHIESSTCQFRRPSTAPHRNGVSVVAQQQLKLAMNRSMSLPGQWFKIWEILFSNEPRPKSPYLGTFLDETMGMIENFWQQEGSAMTKKVLREVPSISMDTNGINIIMKALLKEIRAQQEQPVCATNPSEISDHPPKDEIDVKDMGSWAISGAPESAPSAAFK